MHEKRLHFRAFCSKRTCCVLFCTHIQEKLSSTKKQAEGVAVAKMATDRITYDHRRMDDHKSTIKHGGPETAWTTARYLTQSPDSLSNLMHRMRDPLATTSSLQALMSWSDNDHYNQS